MLGKKDEKMLQWNSLSTVKYLNSASKPLENLPSEFIESGYSLCHSDNGANQATQTKNPEKQSESADEQDNVLRPKIMRKMINLFLTENKYSKDELAILLNIKPEELDQIINQENNSVEIAKKINLFLIKLYCKTKWA